MRTLNYPRRRFTDQQESAIRARVFKQKQDPNAVCKEFGISEQTLRRLCFGSIKRPGIESVYS